MRIQVQIHIYTPIVFFCDPDTWRVELKGLVVHKPKLTEYRHDRDMDQDGRHRDYDPHRRNQTA
ncbi:hypothetical protein CHS0354_000237 [Potamilus streckersoni]|uniref:Uncharacterized protein n=1 Tax=Potamilus streckersoni TaxID=2493646 RepID=A0AAE0RQR4_9BIVA|nr:hypothetical protein CHS0354_000237 [Potamilus streckersoni]